MRMMTLRGGAAGSDEDEYGRNLRGGAGVCVSGLDSTLDCL